MVKFHHEKAGEVKPRLDKQSETKQQEDHNKETEPHEDPRKLSEFKQGQVKDSAESRPEQTKEATFQLDLESNSVHPSSGGT